MSAHLEQEMERLKKNLLQLVAAVEMNLKDAVRALETQDRELAEKVIERDQAVDVQEVQIEENCMYILAKHQPVAIDLRFLIASLKINSDLERIGDQATNIAERALFLSETTMPPLNVDFHQMVETTKEMVHDSLTSLINRNAELANVVRKKDDQVDDLNRQMFNEVREGIRKNPDNIRNYMNILSASRHLERIADHACNIAEDVIYMVEGNIVRHHLTD